jgi:hypothetical protein
VFVRNARAPKPKFVEEGGDDIHSARLSEALRQQSKDVEEGEDKVFRFDFFRRSEFK